MPLSSRESATTGLRRLLQDAVLRLQGGLLEAPPQTPQGVEDSLHSFSQNLGRFFPGFGMERGVLLERKTLICQNSAKFSLNFGGKYFSKEFS
jgi:hypothetical protein